MPIAPIEADQEPRHRLDALKHRKPDGPGENSDQAASERGRREITHFATPSRECQPGEHPGRGQQESHRSEPRFRQARRRAGNGQFVEEHRQRRRSATASVPPITIRATGPTPPITRPSWPGECAGEAKKASAESGNHDLLARPLDTHTDPPRPAVALDDNLSDQGPVDRLGQLEFNRQVRLVDRLKRPAIELGTKPQPLGRGRIDPRRASQEPIADIRDPERLLRDPAPRSGSHEQVLGMNVQLGRARCGRRNPCQPIVELVVGRSRRPGERHQLGPLNSPEKLREPTRGQLVSKRRPVLGRDDEKVVPGTALCAPGQ